jgi:hypothetical protein
MFKVMVKLNNYFDLYTYRKLSVLPPEAQKATYDLGIAIQEMNVSPSKILLFRNSLQDVAPAAVSRAVEEIREIASLYRTEDFKIKSGALHKLFNIKKSHQEQQITLLKANPDLAWLFLFHGNGYVRQEALDNLTSLPMSSFEFTAIVYRLNDWVANVRFSAAQYVSKNFTKIAPEFIGQSAFFLINQSGAFRRWEKDNYILVEEAIYRPDVLDYLKCKFIEIQSGSIGQTLQQLLKRSDFDNHLPELAELAALPSVRASALRTLLFSKAEWFTGYKRQWVNKALGIDRRLASFESRLITTPNYFDKFLIMAGNDKSAHVRKVAASALIYKRSDATDIMDEIDEILKNDKNSSVRSRVEFYIRKRNEKE